MSTQDGRSGRSLAYSTHDDPEISETAEWLFIGPPSGSRQRFVVHAAGFIVLAAIVLGAWLLPGSSNTESGPLTPISAPLAPQQAVPAPGRESARQYANPVDPWVAYAQLCQNNPVQCVSTTPSPRPESGGAHTIPRTRQRADISAR
jgi:hypothetical protein